MITVAPKTSKNAKNNQLETKIKTKPITHKYREGKYFY